METLAAQFEGTVGWEEHPVREQPCCVHICPQGGSVAPARSGRAGTDAEESVNQSSEPHREAEAAADL